jgi:PKD repeat protein
MAPIAGPSAGRVPGEPFELAVPGIRRRRRLAVRRALPPACRRRASVALAVVLAFLVGFVPGSLPPASAADPAVTIVAPDDGEIVDGIVTLQALVSETTASSVEFFYDPHEDDEPEVSLGQATFNPSSSMWELVWDTTVPGTFPDTFNDIDTDGDGIEDLTVNITKPPTHDSLRVAANTTVGTLGDAIELRLQNMLTVRFTLPDNQEDLRGLTDLEVLTTGEFDITSVRFDVYPMSAADQRIVTPFGEFQSLGEPIENAHYGRPLGAPGFPTGTPAFEIGAGTREGARRWVYRGWDTTTIPDGTWLLVATATDAGGRSATYMVESYIVNDLRVVITAPDTGDTVSRFVALEARTSSLTGADNAAPGSLWPATSVVFDIPGLPTIPATETPIGSGRWRAVLNADLLVPGPYTITATATNANPNGAELVTDTIDVTVVAPGAELDAFFEFDWSNCHVFECAFLDGSGGGATSWSWDFGDGNTSTDQNPIHTYGTYGVYTVTLTVSDDGGVTSDSYSRVIPVGNTGVVSFNRNDISNDDLGIAAEVDWTSAFKNFNYEVGSVLAIPVMWDTSVGSAALASLPEVVCDTDEDTPNQECVIFTPEEADGDAPTIVGAADDGALFTMSFTQVQHRGITDIFKGKANIRVVVDVDLDGDGAADQQNQLGTNVDVTNSGAVAEDNRLVKVLSPFEGQFVAGTLPITAGVVSSLAATQVEFFLDGGSIGVDTNGPPWTASLDTTLLADGQYSITALASFGSETTMSSPRLVNVLNTPPPQPPAPGGTFQTGTTDDTTNGYISYRFELPEADDGGGGGPGGGGGRPQADPTIDASMTAEIVPGSIVVHPGGTPNGGLIGGDAIEFDVVLENTSTDPGAILTAYAFQSKFSESPALASRIGDKAFYGVLVPGVHPEGPMTSVKKNGTANGLFSGRWKGICINSSTDFIPEFNSGIEEESLECAGNRTDTNFDGIPEIPDEVMGIAPGETQTVRIRIEAGTTDGALHVVEPGTLQGKVDGVPAVGPNGITYFVPTIDPSYPGSNVLDIPDWGDNKVLRDADGTFNPTFAPLADGLTFDNQQYLTLPRPNFAFTDILGRNHTCETYGLDHIAGTSCEGTPGASPVFGFLDSDDLVPGAQNFAAILHGFGEYVEVAPGEYEAPDFPYDTPCVNLATPDGLRCGARPFTPIAEFYKDNGDGTVTQQMVAGTYGDLVGVNADPYTAFISTSDAEDWKEETFPEDEPGGPCVPSNDPSSQRPSCVQLGTSATGHFHSLNVVEQSGINGGDAVEFTIDITNTSRNPEAYLTAFNYQTKQRNLADIGGLDGFTQDRRDIRTDSTLPLCTSIDDGACYNSSLGVGHFPNVIGNGLLFGQMVWQSGRIDRAGAEIAPDFVHVDATSGIDPEYLDPNTGELVPYGLESVKKNGPFTPILKGNTNFICVKSGLFFPDQDADAACAGDPAILHDTDGELVPENIAQRLGLPPGATQSVRIRMEYGDFRGAILQIAEGTLTPANSLGLARQFDCEDQRELEYCHPDLVGENIVYLPNSTATWLTPTTLEEIEWVIINQPGDAARIMNFQDNFGLILAMAGFAPSAEFYAPDPNPELIGTDFEGVLIRQQVLGEYNITEAPAAAPVIDSQPITTAAAGAAYTYEVNATAYPGPIAYSLDVAPSGMTIDGSTGLISWTPGASGSHDVRVRASNGTQPDAVQSFAVSVQPVLLDDFNRRNGGLGSNWGGITLGYAIKNNQLDVNLIGGPIYWTAPFGVAQEASVTLTTMDPRGHHGLLLKGNRDHLKLSAIVVNYDASRKRVEIVAKEYGKLPRVVAGFGATLRNGDRITAQGLADGSVRVLVNGTLLGTGNAGKFFANRGGHIGLLHVRAGGAFLDDFGGGTVNLG